jgi:outer membrane lipoprotein-sorting protein
MSSQDGRYALRIPSKDKFITGSDDAPATSDNWMENLRSRHILDALFLNALSETNAPRVNYMIEEDTKPDPKGLRSYYVIDFFEVNAAGVAFKLQRIWIDRFDGQVTRKKTFRDDGEIESDVEYQGYESVGGVSFPTTIVLKRPLEDYELKITFSKNNVRLNQTIDPARFTLKPSPKDKVIERDVPAPGAP